jgi:MFS family permease
MERIALGVYVAQQTGSAAWTGLGAALLFLPALVMAPVGGTLADRFERRRYLMTICTAQLAIAGLITALAFFDALSIPALMVLLALTGCSSTMLGPAFSALVTEVVPEEHMGSAMYLNSGQFNLARVVGPALAAGVLAGGGVTWAFAVNTLSFLAVLGALWRVKPKPMARAAVQVPMWLAIRESLQAVRADRGIASALEVTLSTALFISPFVGLIPIFALRELHSDKAGVSLLVTSQGVGAVLSALASSAYVGMFGFRRWISGAAVALIPLSFCYWLSPRLGVAAIFIVFLGAAYLAVMSGCSTVCVTRAPPAMRARVASLFTGSLDATYGMGVMALGMLGDWVGLRAACLSATALYAVSLLWIHRRRPPLLSALEAPALVPPGTVVLAEEAP